MSNNISKSKINKWMSSRLASHSSGHSYRRVTEFGIWHS